MIPDMTIVMNLIEVELWAVHIVSFLIEESKIDHDHTPETHWLLLIKSFTVHTIQNDSWFHPSSMFSFLFFYPFFLSFLLKKYQYFSNPQNSITSGDKHSLDPLAIRGPFICFRGPFPLENRCFSIIKSHFLRLRLDFPLQAAPEVTRKPLLTQILDNYYLKI